MPQVSLVLRHVVPNLPEKLEVLEEYLKQAQALYPSSAEESKEDLVHPGVTCSETGKEIRGARYYASYTNHKGDVVEINLSEDAFKEPTQFDHLPLPYVRFARPVPADAKLPAPLDLTKLHTVDKQISFSFTVTTEPLFFNNKKAFIELLNDCDSQDPLKKVYTSLLKNGNKYEKLVDQVIQEFKGIPEIDQFDQFLLNNKKDVLKFCKGDKSAGDFSAGHKKILTSLSKVLKEDNFSDLQVSFAEAELFYKVAQELYIRLSQRPLKNCHPESLPFLRRKLLQSFTFSIRNRMIQEQIDKLPTGSSQYEISIKRRKAFAFAETGQCDHEGTHTIFG
jgi:hypothetical protein